MTSQFSLSGTGADLNSIIFYTAPPIPRSKPTSHNRRGPPREPDLEILDTSVLATKAQRQQRSVIEPNFLSPGRGQCLDSAYPQPLPLNNDADHLGNALAAATRGTVLSFKDTTLAVPPSRYPWIVEKTTRGQQFHTLLEPLVSNQRKDFPVLDKSTGGAERLACASPPRDTSPSVDLYAHCLSERILSISQDLSEVEETALLAAPMRNHHRLSHSHANESTAIWTPRSSSKDLLREESTLVTHSQRDTEYVASPLQALESSSQIDDASDISTPALTNGANAYPVAQVLERGSRHSTCSPDSSDSDEPRIPFRRALRALGVSRRAPGQPNVSTNAAFSTSNDGSEPRRHSLRPRLRGLSSKPTGLPTTKRTTGPIISSRQRASRCRKPARTGTRSRDIHTPQSATSKRLAARCYLHGTMRSSGSFITFEVSVGDMLALVRQPSTTVLQAKSTMSRKRVVREPYSCAEDELLVRLKQQKQPKLSWSQIQAHFPRRTLNSIQVHYSTRLKNKCAT
ncbi:hypothetical protein LTR17_019971 [Elasticomyces elasticus]|nr:hypothetical protein LTR17_019971 [Elasticomyces elasticus]